MPTPDRFNMDGHKMLYHLDRVNAWGGNGRIVTDFSLVDQGFSTKLTTPRRNEVTTLFSN